MQWYLCIGGYHFKVVEAVAGVETSTIAWLALPARLIIIIIIDEKYDEDEDDDEDDRKYKTMEKMMMMKMTL